MKNWWPTILSALMASFAVVTPVLQNIISHHPIIDAIIGGAAVILAHLKTSPLQ